MVTACSKTASGDIRSPGWSIDSDGETTSKPSGDSSSSNWDRSSNAILRLLRAWTLLRRVCSSEACCAATSAELSFPVRSIALMRSV